MKIIKLAPTRAYISKNLAEDTMTLRLEFEIPAENIEEQSELARLLEHLNGCKPVRMQRVTEEQSELELPDLSLEKRVDPPPNWGDW